MSNLLFPAPPVSTVPVGGRTERVPIRRIFCVGRNDEVHAREMGVDADRDAPFYSTKSSTHDAPSGATVWYPPGTGMELVAVVGNDAFDCGRRHGLPRSRAGVLTPNAA